MILFWEIFFPDACGNVGAIFNCLVLCSTIG